jgi:hypothetical protein
VLTLANEVARDRRLRHRPDALPALHAIGDALLGLPPEPLLGLPPEHGPR